MIILASSSPRRKELLTKITDDFIAIAADIDERCLPGWTAEEYVMAMAEQKAQALRSKYPSAYIIGSDTAVVYQGKILGKPKDKQEAAQMLQLLSGKEHEVYTSVVISSPKKIVKEMVQTKVSFYSLSEQEISDYLQTNEYQDKAGAYGIQGAGALFVKKIDGDFYAVMGFPVSMVNRMSKQLGFIF